MTSIGQSQPPGRHPVVACWGSADSAGAIRVGAWLAAVLGQALELVSAYEYRPVALSARAIPEPGNEARQEESERELTRARHLAREAVEVRESVVPATKTAEAITDLARRADASLIVLGRDTRGQVARTIIRTATCPVVIVPGASPAPQAPVSVCAADDGSPAARLAVLLGDALVARAGGDARRRSVSVGEGSAGARLLEESERADFLACGSRGHGRVLGTVLGSVSGLLVREARCPVIVIPRRVRECPGAPLGVTTAATS